MNDLLGFGKVLPMDKLLDILTGAFGAVTKPFFDRRDVDTKAYEIRKIAEAKVDAMKMLSNAIRENSVGVGGVNYSEGGITIESSKQPPEQPSQGFPVPALEDRTRTRIDYQEAKKQLNLEGVTSFAADELKNDPFVTDEPVDEGWTSRFFTYAEDISDEGMQSIWGRILAGEIKQPNTYSLRTLEALRNLSKREAEIFTLACNLSLESGNGAFLFKGTGDFLSKHGLDYRNLAVLREVGMIHEGELTNVQLLKSDQPVQSIFMNGNIVIIITKKPDSEQNNIPVYVFTQVGAQLLKLVKAAPSITYLNAFGEFVKNDNVTAKYAYLLDKTRETIRHTHPILDFPLIDPIRS